MSGWNWPVIAIWAYFCLAAFSCGCMAVSGILNFLLLKRYPLGFNSVATYRIMMSLGWVLTAGTLLWLTLPAAQTGTDFRSPYYWCYLAGLSTGSLGAIGLAFKNINIHVHLENRFNDQLDAVADYKAKELGLREGEDVVTRRDAVQEYVDGEAAKRRSGTNGETETS